jgi:hypothetical protein
MTIFKSSTQHAKELVFLLRQLADLIDSDPSKVEWKEVQKTARYFWQGSLIGRLMAYNERKRK